MGAAATIQAYVRGLYARRLAAQLFHDKQHRMVVRLQAVARCFIHSRRHRWWRLVQWRVVNGAKLQAALPIQAAYRRKVAARKAARRLCASVLLGCWWRFQFTRRTMRATRIQALVRGVQTRRRILLERIAKAQALARGMLARLHTPMFLQQRRDMEAARLVAEAEAVRKAQVYAVKYLLVWLLTEEGEAACKRQEKDAKVQFVPARVGSRVLFRLLCKAHLRAG